MSLNPNTTSPPGGPKLMASQSHASDEATFAHAESRSDTDASLLTVDRIFGSDKELQTEEWGPAHWLKNSSGYSTLMASEKFKDRKDIVKYDPESGLSEILVAAENLIPAGQSVPLKIQNYAWSEDSQKVLIFTETKRVWRHETRGDYWVLDRNNGEMKKLGGDADPSMLMFATFSPDGTRVGYVYKNNVYVQSIADLEITQLTSDGAVHIINGTADWVNEEEFNLRNGFRWSPDGLSIAYWQFDTAGVSEFPLINNTATLYPKVTTYAYPKVGQTNSATRVGVVSAKGGKTLWFTPNDDPRNHYIPRMEWSSDSRHVIFQHLNRLQNTLQFISADPQTGELKTILTDTDDAWVDVMNEWRWIENGDRFILASERSGWRHLYSVSIVDQSVTLLTPGEFDITSLAGIDEANGYVYFIASPENPTQRYLFRAKLDGSGDVVRVSPSDQSGTHSYTFSDDGRWAFHSYSAFCKPPVVGIVHLPDHKFVRLLAENDALETKIAALTPCAYEFLKVSHSDGVEVDAWCIKPPNFDPKKSYPLFIHVYGEPAASTVLDIWGGQTQLWHYMLAQQGYVVMSIDNRGTPAPLGRAWRKSVYRQIGILASADQAAAVQQILKDRPYIDPARVGVWGWSGGGSMSLNAMFRYPEVYRMAMAIAFVANQKFYDTIYQERYMGLPDDNEEGFKNGSPVTFASGLKGDLLIVYGTGDDNCHYQNCEVMVDELIKQNKQFLQVSYPNCGHALDESANTRRHLYSTLTHYLIDHLPLQGSLA